MKIFCEGGEIYNRAKGSCCMVSIHTDLAGFGNLSDRTGVEDEIAVIIKDSVDIVIEM